MPLSAFMSAAQAVRAILLSCGFLEVHDVAVYTLPCVVLRFLDSP